MLHQILVSITNVEEPLEKDSILEKEKVSQFKNAVEKKLKALLDNRPIIPPEEINPAIIPHQMTIFGETIYGVSDYDHLMGAFAYLLEFIKKVVIAKGKLHFLISQTTWMDGTILGIIKRNEKITLTEVYGQSLTKLYEKEAIEQVQKRIKRLIDSGLIYQSEENKKIYFLPTTKGLRVSL
ncbi:hypothetical protein M23134_07363 [Microscilla marina ATCC 23134]|uniref:Uncharacterized protein n=2 Tax=Microscilla marina TaxID=1027 RepID=A1ZEK4_MICM2|nr:hypothetical protein M23134_07363 [Microscilla marina ATCC 23134]